MENDIQSITPDQVVKAYSGRVGCMCGCKGKYSYNPVHQHEGSAERGYTVDDDELNLTSLTRILRRLQAEPKTELQDGCILHVQVGNRQYAAYLCKAARKE